ncbi:MAG: endolytic transglycosylase MltG [Acetobacter sp.]|nr:endolytic transglycosylase MltG [Bacteroides sp.]MCM1340737.1 endolytic transglycosylase MltG [Acetobacter sp.]MCM1433074.1 endolytic transglycosylase MltG [Clostridiales bacterium]
MAKKKNKGIAVLFVFLVIAVIAAVGYFGYDYAESDINGDRDNKTEYNLEIESADFQYDVGQKLVQNDIIKNDTIWSAWMDKNYPNFKYINGEYTLNSAMSYEEIAQKLQDPDISHTTVSVCIPEGYTVFKIADVMQENNICSSDEFLAECKSADKYADEFGFLNSVSSSSSVAYELEGFLFPATYDLGENSTAEEVVREMLTAFSNRVSASWNEYCEANNMTLYELITLASVVEKETLGDGVAENIASVFVNRLNNGQQLQSDVTIDYGNALREAGFSDDIVTSYNTYKCKALPSGPICNPGIANIDAVINHNDTDYFYFFSYNNGADFYFTDNYNDFQTEWAKLGSTNTN